MNMFMYIQYFYEYVYVYMRLQNWETACFEEVCIHTCVNLFIGI